MIVKIHRLRTVPIPLPQIVMEHLNLSVVGNAIVELLLQVVFLICLAALGFLFVPIRGRCIFILILLANLRLFLLIIISRNTAVFRMSCVFIVAIPEFSISRWHVLASSFLAAAELLAVESILLVPIDIAASLFS